MQTNTDNGILAEAADLVAQWRRAASRCFDGDPDLAGRLSLRRERLFDDLRTRLASAEGLTERCSLISAMFAVTLDAASVPDPDRERTCRTLAQSILATPECTALLDASAPSDDPRTAAVRRLAEDLEWPE